MRHVKLVPICCVAIVALSTSALSADNRFYVAIDAGTTRGDGTFTGGSATNFVTEERSDSSETFRARVGYQFWRYMAVEAGYIDMGDFAYRLNPANCPPAVPTNCDFTAQLSASGLLASAVFILPVGERWSLKARSGWYHFRFETRESGPNASGNPARGKDSEANVHFAAAASFRATERVELELGWTWFEEPGFAEVNSAGAARFNPGDMAFTSLGVAIRF
jgi:opacity protein-like surface antigen